MAVEEAAFAAAIGLDAATTTMAHRTADFEKMLTSVTNKLRVVQVRRRVNLAHSVTRRHHMIRTNTRRHP